MDLDLWTQNIKRTIEQIASREYQELAWFGKASYVSSPEEMLCTLFDDYQFDDFLERNDTELSNSQKFYGKLLQQKMNDFSKNMEDTSNPEEIIDNSDWAEIRNIARKFLE